MAISENSRKVITYLQGLDKAANVTAADVADKLGLEKRVVDGVFTSAIQRKQLGARVEKEIELSDGSHKMVKFLKLNADGYAFDPDAVAAAE